MLDGCPYFKARAGNIRVLKMPEHHIRREAIRVESARRRLASTILEEASHSVRRYEGDVPGSVISDDIRRTVDSLRGRDRRSSAASLDAAHLLACQTLLSVVRLGAGCHDVLECGKLLDDFNARGRGIFSHHLKNAAARV